MPTKGMGSMKRLTKSQDKQLLAGVCARNADYVTIDLFHCAAYYGHFSNPNIVFSNRACLYSGDVAYADKGACLI